MISFQNICKDFQSNFWEKKYSALKDVSFDIEKGDLVGFLGANGAGKTTLIKIMMGFSKATKGQVVFGNELGRNALEARSSIGYLPERAYLYQHLTGLEFLKYIISLNKIDEKIAFEKLNELSVLLKMDQALNRKISGYSKGMQQRLGFISSIIHDPKFIVLDEPLSGLDPVGRQEFKQILKKLNKNGTTIFFSSHVVADVEEICSKVIFLENGKLVYEGEIEKLISKNSSEDYQVKYKENNLINHVKLSSNEKNILLKELVQKGCEVLEVERVSPTLEEIIYKIKK